MSEVSAQEKLTQAKQKIGRMHKQLEKRNHFDLLGVSRDSSPEEVQAAYHSMARQWHTDAFAGMRLGGFQGKLDEIFQTIGQAYETLSDAKLRSEYIVLLDRQASGMSTDVVAILRAEELMDQAQAQLRRKQWAEAIETLEEARKLNPDDNFYIVNQAWAVYNAGKRSESAAKKAEKMFEYALSRQDSLPKADQYLGHMAFDHERYPEAKKWWKKCLQWDRKNVEAQRGLRLANTRQEKQSSGLSGFINKLFKKG